MLKLLRAIVAEIFLFALTLIAESYRWRNTLVFSRLAIS